MNAKNNDTLTNESQIDNERLLDFLGACICRWPIFVASLLICLILGCAKIVITPKQYRTTASVLIKESAKANSSNNIEAILSGEGLVAVSSKLANEIATFKSPYLMDEVVARLGLDVNCSMKGKIHDIDLYGENVPFRIVFPEGCPTPLEFMIAPNESGYEIWNMTFTRPDKSVVNVSGKINGTFSDTLSTEIGPIVVNLAPDYAYSVWDKPVKVRKSGRRLASSQYSSRLAVTADDIKNNSDVLNLSFMDVCARRAEDILSMLITVYNEWWVADNNKVAVGASSFITERLASIEEELGRVDESISQYKSRNLLPDITEASKIFMNEGSEIGKQIKEVENQIYVANYVKKYLADSQNASELIPTMSGLGITDNNLYNQINQYNALLLQRNTLLEKSSEKNPKVIELNHSLSTMRTGVISSVDNLISTLEAKNRALRQHEIKVNHDISNNPNQEKYLLNVERQQKVKESLYLFLLQKREENELSQAFTAYNTKVITPPVTGLSPVEPKRAEILLIAFLVGLLIPFAYVYARLVSDTRVRGRKDLEKLSVPFLGEIPFDGKITKKKGQPRNYTVSVKPSQWDFLNESYRILRSNLDFMNTDDSFKVTAVTSFNLGSGKTYVTINTAATLSLVGKKVLAVDCDFRKAVLSSFVNRPKTGLSDYLAGRTDELESLAKNIEGYDNLYVLPVGSIPPNPSELLSTGKMRDAVQSLKPLFDYIILDCPPLDAVADAQIVNSVATRTLFVIRTGLLERGLLPEIQKIYDDQRLAGMVIVLNGTPVDDTHYGYRYAYRYGYKYHAYLQSDDRS